MEVAEKARSFAEKKHSGQKRRTGEDYIVHPIRVAEIVKAETAKEPIADDEKEKQITAAYLHDILEDTETTARELEYHFGTAVAALVTELTNDPEAIKRFGKGPYLAAKMEKMSEGALTVKLADRLDNMNDTDSEDAARLKRKCDETSYILDRLSRRTDLTACQKRLIDRIRERTDICLKMRRIREAKRP